MITKNYLFTEFLTSVDTEIGRDEESIHLFEWVVEDRYEAKIIEGMDYYADRPDLRSIQNEQILYELNTMENYFVSKEEYEKCASIVKVRADLKQIII
jgi:hypothetical protein